MFHKIRHVSRPLIPQTKVLSCLILVVFRLLVVNIYLPSLKINLSSSVMVAKSFNSCIALCNYIITICISITSILTTQALLKFSDIETNSGPKKSSAIKFRLWNLNGLVAYEFVKVLLIEGFSTTHNFDIACLSQFFLDSTIFRNDENININSCSLLRVDHPNDIKRGGVCMYFKESLR